MKTEKVSQPDTLYTTKQRRNRVWLICFTLLLGLSLLFFYGYCWGLWGRNSLLLQYLFQCGCPVSSTEARYPEEVDVIVPACRQSTVWLSPSGRLLRIREKRFGATSHYLLDLQTMKKNRLTEDAFSSFLTDDLWFIKKGIEDYVIDRTAGRQYPIKIFRFWRENSYINGEPNLGLLITALHQAGQVFFIQDSDTVVVLSPSFRANLEQNFTFDRSDIPGRDSNRVEQFLQESKIVYQTIVENFPEEAVSPDGRFIARYDGIYLTETNQLIVRAYPSRLRGWAYDSHKVIYSSSSRCLIRIKIILADDDACFFRVPQPVLELKVPEDYLMPMQLY